jgi:hypothetical protein
MSAFWMFISISLTLLPTRTTVTSTNQASEFFLTVSGHHFWEYELSITTKQCPKLFWKRFIHPRLILASLQIISKINVGSTNRASEFFLTVLGHYFWKYEPSTTTKQCPKDCLLKIVHPRLIPTSLQAYLPPDPSNLRMFGMIMATFLGNLDRIECWNNGPNNIC